MKRVFYVKPLVEVVKVEIEKGFATSNSSFGIKQLKYDTTGGDPENTAW